MLTEKGDKMTEEIEEEDTLTCNGCGESVDYGDEFVYNGEDYCDNCVTTCDSWRCRVVMLVEDATEAYDGNFYCESCSAECEFCQHRHHADNLYPVGGNSACEDCVRYCDSCCEYYPQDETRYSDSHDAWYCDDCYPPERLGVRPYGHTRAHSYLRTKEEMKTLSSDERWYIGIEHEITAPDDCDAEHVYKWAEQHLGSTDYIECKEDSSVEGFEIVTQPMTPAFFEQVDWDSYMRMLDRHYPIRGEEPEEHGIHVHVGRKALNHDDINVAAYSYLLSQGNHLERIARREPYHYCEKVTRPVSTAVVAKHQRQGTDNPQFQRLRYENGVYPGRNAINLTNGTTIEIRAFRSTRKAQDLRDAVRVTYLGAEYIRSLRNDNAHPNGKTLHWSEFARWVGQHHPEAFRSIAGL